MILVSGDSDLLPVIRMIKDDFPEKEIVVYIPARTEIRGAAIELRAEAHKHKTLPLDLLPKSQFPASVVLPGGQRSQGRLPCNVTPIRVIAILCTRLYKTPGRGVCVIGTLLTHCPKCRLQNED